MEPIRLGSLTLYPFGLVLALLALGALALIAHSMNKAGLKKETASWFAVLHQCAAPQWFGTISISIFRPFSCAC